MSQFYYYIQQVCTAINHISLFKHKQWLGLLLFCLPILTFSQQITVKLNPDKILIGNQAQLTIQVENVQKNSSGIQQWLQMPDTFGHIQVVKREPIDTFTVDGNTIFSQKITITSFDSGSWKIPALTVVFNNKQIVTNKNTPVLTVLPANVLGMNDYNGFTDIISVTPPPKPFPWWIIAAAITAVVLAFIIIQWARKLRKQKSVTVSPPKTKEQIFEALTQLKEKYPYASGNDRLLFTELVELCRSFTDICYQQNTQSYTTDEYMIIIKNKIGNESVQNTYFQMLRLADAVKFAQYKPTENEVNAAIDAGKQMAKTVQQFSIQPK
ncbi:hypothetical protein [Hydrotalea sp.]|uniref:hypothetical protein n=1 Tax=Hydrotalea sp. TaxID=2881279 RepID=UPI003D14072F